MAAGQNFQIRAAVDRELKGFQLGFLGTYGVLV